MIDGRGSASMRVARGALEEVVEHARAAYPAECCGVLVGTDSDIVDAVRTRNLADHPHRFLIDPRDHIEARRDARRRGLRIVGFYHSHPDAPAAPSAVDRAEASYAEHFYLIVSVASGRADATLFRLTDGDFVETPMVVAT